MVRHDLAYGIRPEPARAMYPMGLRAPVQAAAAGPVLALDPTCPDRPGYWQYRAAVRPPVM